VANNWAEQGKQYTAFVEAELKAEYERRGSVNARAASALTASTGLVTLVLGVFAVFVGKDFVLTGCARGALAVALVFLLLGAASAVIAGVPWRSKVPSPQYLQMLLDDYWETTETAARNITADFNVAVIRKLRAGTEIKFKFLIASSVCQLIATGALVVCTLTVV
jgi:hypothetical protein